jgi:hypothetical protein
MATYMGEGETDPLLPSVLKDYHTQTLKNVTTVCLPSLVPAFVKEKEYTHTETQLVKGVYVLYKGVCGKNSERLDGRCAAARVELVSV